MVRTAHSLSPIQVESHWPGIFLDLFLGWAIYGVIVLSSPRSRALERIILGKASVAAPGSPAQVRVRPDPRREAALR